MLTTLNKKLIIVSYYLPPSKTVASVRISNFHKEATFFFSSIHALTTSNRKLFPKDNFVFDDSNTSEVWTFDLRRFLIKKNSASTNIKQTKKESSLIKNFIKLSYSFPFNLFLADGGLTYIWGGFVHGKKIIKQNNIDVLFSSYKPYSDHLICFLLKKWNPNLIWIADFRDLHVDEIRKNVLFPIVQKWFNRVILKKADIVTTVSNGLAKQLGEYHSNVYILRNGISSSYSFPKERINYDKFTITYTGSIYPKLQSAKILFQVIEELIKKNKINTDKIQLIYAGTECEIWENWVNQFNLQKISISNDTLPNKKIHQLQEASHVNLLMSWSNEKQQGILTAKFYEYLAARNSILLLINGIKDEEFENIFQETNAGLVAYNDSTQHSVIENFILEKYQEWDTTGSVQKPITVENLKPFIWNNQMKKFITFLNQS